MALGNMGIAHAALGKHERAVELYEQNLVLAREIGNRGSEVIASWNLVTKWRRRETSYERPI